MDSSFAAFVGLSAVVIMTPGQDTALTIRNTLLGGRAAGVATASGVALGQASWTLAASLGLTALLVASEPAFVAIRVVGAAYLVYLGAHSIWLAIGRHPTPVLAEAPPATMLTTRTALRQGTLSNLANPKMAIFFSSLLPQFAQSGSSTFASMLLLGVVFVGMTLAWLSAYAMVVARVGHVLRRPRILRAFEAVMGAILVAFGVRLAFDQR
jgi:threonine/homoserine/homoserine lactone efflux protein